MKLNIELGNKEVRDMLIAKMQSLMPDVDLNEKNIRITVKSKQNFRVHDWEDGEIKVEYIASDL